MYQYQESQRFFAQTQRLLEPVASEELQELGAVRCKDSFCGVYFQASPEVLYKIVYCARTVNRVLAPLITFSCPSKETLYKTGYHIPWSEFFSIKETFAIHANVSENAITHSGYAAFLLKDAIVDYFRKKLGKRPNVDPRQADIRFGLNIHRDRAIISLDVSGESLHRRGYRVAPVTAPLQETLAAAILRISAWQADKPLLDPMCGSGTILAEALMKYANIPAGFKRKNLGFFYLPDFDPKTWKKVKKACDKNFQQPPPSLIHGSDNDKQAVKAARQNLNQIPGGLQVLIKRNDFQDIENAENHVIITNPPYGVRIDKGKREKLQEMYRQLGDFLKQKCKGSTAYILCGDKELTKHIGLKISRRIPLYNGPLETRLVKIEVY
ncbi:MAG: THUMP domain-containing protein [Candidatus Aminicenantes bacterium]|jgi:putative N6-adenine-specific DNA methylase